MVMFDFKKNLFNVIMFNLGDFLWQCKFQKTNLRVLNTYTIFKHLINPFKFYKTFIFWRKKNEIFGNWLFNCYWLHIEGRIYAPIENCACFYLKLYVVKKKKMLLCIWKYIKCYIFISVHVNCWLLSIFFEVLLVFSHFWYLTQAFFLYWRFNPY